MGWRASDPRSRVPRPGNVQALLFQWRKLALLGAAAIVLLVGDSALLRFGPPSFVAALVRAWRTADMPSVATAASFSVSAGSFATEGKAASFAAALDASGLPILVRVRPDDNRYQVLVGPYVSTDEAEHAQRALAAWGLGEARLVVDDTMRSTTRASVFGAGEASNGVVLASAPGMSSLVFEMMNRPRNVEARRSSATTIDVSVGESLEGSQAATQLALPDGVLLVSDLSVQNGAGNASLHARIVVPEGVESRLRLEGRRVYLDLAWPKAPWTIAAAGRQAVAAPKDPASVLSEPGTTYRDQLAPIGARFDEIAPFLVSAAGSPDTDVLAALGHSLDGVRDAVTALTVEPEREPSRQALLAALARASSAMAPAFSGDRAATVREAVALFDASTK